MSANSNNQPVEEIVRSYAEYKACKPDTTKGQLGLALEKVFGGDITSENTLKACNYVLDVYNAGIVADPKMTEKYSHVVFEKISQTRLTKKDIKQDDIRLTWSQIVEVTGNVRLACLAMEELKKVFSLPSSTPQTAKFEDAV